MARKLLLLAFLLLLAPLIYSYFAHHTAFHIRTNAQGVTSLEGRRCGHPSRGYWLVPTGHPCTAYNRVHLQLPPNSPPPPEHAVLTGTLSPFRPAIPLIQFGYGYLMTGFSSFELRVHAAAEPN